MALNALMSLGGAELWLLGKLAEVAGLGEIGNLGKKNGILEN
jgi:hypothetical protein